MYMGLVRSLILFNRFTQGGNKIDFLKKGYTNSSIEKEKSRAQPWKLEVNVKAVGTWLAASTYQ